MALFLVVYLVESCAKIKAGMAFDMRILSLKRTVQLQTFSQMRGQYTDCASAGLRNVESVLWCSACGAEVQQKSSTM